MRPASDSKHPGMSSDDVIYDDGDYEPLLFFPQKTEKEVALLSKAKLQSVVRKLAGHEWVLRPGQFEVVTALRPSGHVFCGFPTAAGKTLIACANALLDYTFGIAGVYIMCQPLQALVGQTNSNMTMTYFAKTSVAVVVWNEEPAEERDCDLRDKVTMILAAPEELDSVFAVCRKAKAVVRGLMIDEAHLREEWPFRNYLASDRFTSTFPDAMVGIFSATMGPDLVADFTKSMALKPTAMLFDHRNVPELLELQILRLRQLVIRICEPADILKVVVDAAAGLEPDEAIVIFAASYSVLSRNTELLFHPELKKLNPMMYCADYMTQRRKMVVECFASKQCRLVVATCAFGTGVDFPHIRHVFFHCAPKTWSAFVQQAGRGGRGDFGKPVYVTLACSPTDLKLADRRVQILSYYCAKATGTKKDRKKLICPDCQQSHDRPSGKGVEFSGLCFDFEGVACRTQRQACLRTIACFFQGVGDAKSLEDRKRDCGVCSSCLRVATVVVFKPGDRVRVVENHPQHAGCEGIVCEVRQHVMFRSEDGVQRALDPSKLKRLGNDVHEIPPKLKQNKLAKDERKRLGDLLHRELLARQLNIDGIFFGNVRDRSEVDFAAKHNSHPLVSNVRFAALQEVARNGDDESIRFDRKAAFESFAELHDASVVGALADSRKRGRSAVSKRKL